jgi:hypothetical protein
MTHLQLAHAESAANAVAGLVLAQLVLFAFGVPVREAVALNIAMLAVSYARSFVLRLIFSRGLIRESRCNSTEFDSNPVESGVIRAIIESERTG